MTRLAFTDDQLVARQFNTGDTVRKPGLRGLFISPYTGRVLWANVDTGVVHVQWPWGSESETASELILDISGDYQAPVIDQSYSSWEGARSINSPEVQKTEEKFRKSLASSLVSQYELRTLPIRLRACQLANQRLSELDVFRKLSSEFSYQFGHDAVRITVSNLFTAGRRLAIYWADPARKYRVTQKEKDSGCLSCPRCKNPLKSRTYRQGQRVLNCRSCGFSIHPEDLMAGK